MINEERIIDIETKFAYQEETLFQLNEVIYAQQKQIDQLEATCKQLIGRISEISESRNEQQSSPEKPPHY